MVKYLLKKYLPPSYSKKLKIIYDQSVLRFIIEYRRIKKNYIYKINKPIIYLVGTPYHSNLGDQAIAYSEYVFLTENCRNYTIHEIPDEDFYVNLAFIKKHIMSEDIIILHGGGNMGDEYIGHEKIRRLLISIFKNNKIILFPQTVYYSASKKGAKALKKTLNCFSSHKNLYLCSRDEISYKILKKYFTQNTVYSMPDIVMYLKLEIPKQTRDKIIVCLRNDEEKEISEDTECKIKSFTDQACRRGFDVVTLDMLGKHKIYPEDRKTTLENRFLIFSSARLVITDRLHGMIFSALTGTPCIAFNNYNHKVSATYKWLEALEYIKLLNCTDDIEPLCNTILSSNLEYSYDNSHLDPYFARLADLINGEL